MLLTLPEAASKLGKSERQLRYMIQQGTLQAEKRGGRWLVEIAALPPSSGQAAAAQRRQEALRGAVEDALALPAPDAATRRYSVRDLKAFQIGKPLYERTAATLGKDHAAAVALRDVLLHLSRGCHRFARDEKAVAYREARDAASHALCALVLTDATSPPVDVLADTIEQDLMPAFAGLLRRVERKLRW